MTEDHFVVAHSCAADPDAAAREAATLAVERLGGREPTLVVMFVAATIAAGAETVAEVVVARLGPVRLIGCTTDRPVASDAGDSVPTIVLWCASLVDSGGVAAAHVTWEPGVDGGFVVGWPDPPGPTAAQVLLADPFTFPVERLLDEHSDASIVGGLASGGASSAELPLFVDGAVVRGGAVVASLPASMFAVVAQGCEPVGPEMTVTGCAPGVITELAGRPADETLRSAVGDLVAADPAMASRGLLVGIVVDQNRPDYERGNFLVRGIQGRDPATGGLVIGSRVRVGQTVRLHVRDESVASRDLADALHAVGQRGEEPHGAGLLFTCFGRIGGLFADPMYDAHAVRDALEIPVAGMAAGGEIGPVGGRPFLHGYTAVALIPQR